MSMTLNKCPCILGYYNSNGNCKCTKIFIHITIYKNAWRHATIA
jgi:hypothetical protein